MLKEIKKGSVALLMPCAGPVEPRVVQSTINMVSFAQMKGIPVLQIGITDRTLIHTARNILANGFLETECEWSMWIDSDMILEARTIDVMLRRAETLKAQMLTGIYYKRLGQHHPVLWRKTLESKDGKVRRTIQDRYACMTIFPDRIGGQPFQADVAGFGCTLIHRSVFEKLKKPYFRFDFFTDDSGKEAEVSEDFYFFTLAREAGFELWAITELKCGHLGNAPVVTHADMQIDMTNMTEMDLSYKSLELVKGESK